MSSYHQYCALTRALDIVGDRWTLLIVRELIPGPRRFTDLIAGLPGLSRNLLTERLRALESDGMVARRELPPPVARRVYELTEDGHDLAEAVGPLIVWGAQRMGERAPSDRFHPRWSAVAMAALADREAAKGIRETYQYNVGPVAFHFIVDDGSIRVRDGEAEAPAVTVTTDEQTWADIAAGKISVSSAVAAGSLAILAGRGASTRLKKILRPRQVLAAT
jgi:DNA-binding HxlR family transcriptional regulator/putative sterol carrier protein